MQLCSWNQYMYNTAVCRHLMVEDRFTTITCFTALYWKFNEFFCFVLCFFFQSKYYAQWIECSYEIIERKLIAACYGYCRKTCILYELSYK